MMSFFYTTILLFCQVATNVFRIFREYQLAFNGQVL